MAELATKRQRCAFEEDGGLMDALEAVHELKWHLSENEMMGWVEWTKLAAATPLIVPPQNEFMETLLLLGRALQDYRNTCFIERDAMAEIGNLYLIKGMEIFSVIRHAIPEGSTEDNTWRALLDARVGDRLDVECWDSYHFVHMRVTVTGLLRHGSSVTTVYPSGNEAKGRIEWSFGFLVYTEREEEICSTAPYYSITQLTTVQ